MEHQLTTDEKEWIGRAIEKGIVRLKIKSELVKANYDTDRIDAMLEFYDMEMDSLREAQDSNEIVDTPEEKEEFKINLKKYFSDNKKDLSKSEQRFIKKYIKNVKRYSKALKGAIVGFKNEMEFLYKQNWEKGKVEKELEYLKVEIAQRLMDSTKDLEIINPKTGEEVTKENLLLLSVEELLGLMDDNVETLDLIVNGKITE